MKRAYPATARWIEAATALLLLIALVAAYRTTAFAVTLQIDGESHRLHTHQPTVAYLLADRGIALRAEDEVEPGLETPLHDGMTVVIHRAHPVILEVDGMQHLLYLRQANPYVILREAGVVIGPNDGVHIEPPAPTDPEGTTTRIIVRHAVPIVLEEGNVRTPFYTDAATVGEALLQSGITLYRADHIFPGPETPIQSGMHIRLERSIPVSVQVDGHVLRTRTHRHTVGEVLSELGITLSGLDYSDPPLDRSLGEGLEIRVVRVSESIIVEQSPIPFETVWQGDPEMELDHHGLLQEGKPGVLERRIRIRYEDGEVVSRQVEGESVVKAPVNRVMGYGTKIVIRTLQTEAGPMEYWRVIHALATSYSASTAGVSPDLPYYGRTATGLPMGDGIVAVDPNVIPLGTKVYVPGYGLGLAADTGGAIRGRRIDLGYDDEHLKLWYAWVDVYLLTPVPAHINYLLP